MGNKRKIREEARKLNPMDDLLFRKMSEDRAFCEEILRVILSDSGLAVLHTTVRRNKFTGAFRGF